MNSDLEVFKLNKSSHVTLIMLPHCSKGNSDRVTIALEISVNLCRNRVFMSSWSSVPQAIYLKENTMDGIEC